MDDLSSPPIDLSFLLYNSSATQFTRETVITAIENLTYALPVCILDRKNSFFATGVLSNASSLAIEVVFILNSISKSWSTYDKINVTFTDAYTEI